MVARLRHPDGWLFQVKDATKTLGLTYGDGFDTAKMLVNDRICQMFGRMDQYKRVWRSPISLPKKCLYMNGEWRHLEPGALELAPPSFK